VAAPLTPKQQKAADLIGRGWTKSRAAREVGTSGTSIRRWLRRDDFRALIERRRESVIAKNPTPRAALEEALTATNSRGEPDHKVRVTAARILIAADSSGSDPEDKVRETVILTHALDDDDED
jgi:hypothetical protein